MINEKWLSIEEAVQYLGINRDTIYRWIKNRNFPAHRVGRIYKVKKEEIDQWVNGNKSSESTSKMVLPTCVDAFCGAGGLSLGLKNAGFDLRYAFDNNLLAVKSYNHYFSDCHCEQQDAREITGRYIIEKSHLLSGEDLDLFAGGPPCQGFSRQKKNACQDTDIRNQLVVEYARIVSEIHPKAFMLENVDMLGLARGAKYFSHVQSRLDDYDIYPNFYNSVNYGVAQTRVRFITVGIRKDLHSNYALPEPTVTKWLTVGEVLNGLPEPPEDYSVHPDYFNHQNARVTKENIYRFSFVPQGGGWQDIPFEHRLPCHQRINASKGGWTDCFGRLEWDGQCPTITGGFDSFTRGRYGHPFHDRPLTPREAARLQGFPDDFLFCGTRADIRKQIGNAVPPPMACAIGKAILKALGKD